MFKTSLFTVSFAGFWGQQRLNLEESIDQAAELGFQGVEIMGKRPHLSVLDYSLDDCKRLREHIERRGLQTAAVAAYTNFTGGMDKPEIPFLEMQIDYVDQLAQRAAVLGCDLVRVFASYERNDVPMPRQWQCTVDALRECCDRAAQHGVSIGLQNHHDWGVATKSYLELLSQVGRPNLVPMYDCWSIHLMGEDVAAGAAQLAPRMRFTTVADYISLPRWRYSSDLNNYTPEPRPFVQAVPMGEGELEYRTFFNVLKKALFDGWVSYETCSPLRGGGSLENIQEYARKFLAYMRQL